jgi:predicted DNA-binding transcriptional regulator AlpA
MKTLLTIKQVSARVSLSKFSIYRRMKDEKFPKPLVIGGSHRWVEETLDAWLAREDEKVNNTIIKCKGYMKETNEMIES